MPNKQVNKEHYRFSRYLDKRRWLSVWHQLDEVLALEPASVLEIGPGPGLFKATAALFGVQVETVDLDPELKPDHVASADAMPFADDAYEVVCAFQMLEHVPYEKSLKIFAEMARVAKRRIVISLPDSRPALPCSIPLLPTRDARFYVPLPLLGDREHVFDGEHYWEINKKGWSLEKVCGDLCTAGNVKVRKTYRVKENPPHRFFVFGFE